MDLNKLLMAKDVPAFEYESKKIIKSMQIQERRDLYEELIADNVANMIMQDSTKPNVERFLNILSEYVSWDEDNGNGYVQIDERLTHGKVKQILDALEKEGYCDKWKSGKDKRLCAMVCKMIQEKVPGEFTPTNGNYEYKPFEDYFGTSGMSKRVHKIESEGASVRGIEKVIGIINKEALP